MSGRRKVLFAHDGPLYVRNKHEYFGVHYDNSIKERYLNLGDSVSFMMRLEAADDSKYDELSRISNKNFNFIEIPDFKSIPGYIQHILPARRIISNAVSSHDVLVARLPSSIGTLAVKSAQNQGTPYLVEYVGDVYDALWNYDWRGK